MSKDNDQLGSIQDDYEYYHDYLHNFTQLQKIGSNYVLRKDVVHKRDVVTYDDKGLKKVNKYPSTEAINFTILDKNLKPIGFHTLKTNPNLVELMDISEVTHTDDELVLLGNKKKEYYLIKVKYENGEYNFSINNIKLPYSKLAKEELYFAAPGDHMTLVDEDKRVLYLQNQIYPSVYGGQKLAHVGISKIAY